MDEEITDESKKVDLAEDQEPETKKLSIWWKILRGIQILGLFFKSSIISITAKLNNVSRDYRYVARRLAVEKKALKLLFEIEECDGTEFNEEWKREFRDKVSQAYVRRQEVTRDSKRKVIAKLDRPQSESIEYKSIF